MSSLKILLGMTGSVGILNMPSYLPILNARYPQMKVILTKSTGQFITKDAVSLVANEVYTDLFPTPYKAEKSHVWLAAWADLFIVLPTTAHLLAQVAHGFADTLLTATILSHSKPVWFIPNMNPAMWNNPATQKNISTLRDYGHVIAPFSRQMAFEVSTKELKEAFVMPPVDRVIQLIEEEAMRRSKDLIQELSQLT